MKLALLLAIILSTGPEQEVYLRLRVTGRERINLAVAQFDARAEIPEGVRPKIKELRGVVVDDLDYSLYFNLIQPPGVALDPELWFAHTAQAVLDGRLIEGEPSLIEMELSDPQLNRSIRKERFKLSGDLRWVAHRISDWVVHTLTGEKGIARTRIAFSVRTQGGRELGVADYDGHNLHIITRDGHSKLSPDWSPKGDRLAYASYKGERLSLYELRLGENRTSPISAPPQMAHTPAWSPDGSRIAFTGATDGNSEVYILDGAGRCRQLTHHPAIDVSPAWSPTGRELVFVSDRTGTPQLYIMDADGGNLRRLTYEGSYNTSPAWSPKGDLITYVSKDADGRHQIWVTDLSGEIRLRLTSEGNNEDPSWSPDGLHIAFSSDRTGRYEIYTMHWDGSGQRRITNCGATSPTWSPRLER